MAYSDNLEEKIKMARQQGYSDAQIKTFLSAKGVQPTAIQSALAVPQEQPQQQEGLLSRMAGSIPTTALAGVNDVAEGFKELQAGPQVRPQDVKDATAGGGIFAGLLEGASQVARAGMAGVGSLGKMVGGALSVPFAPIFGPASTVGGDIGTALGSKVSDAEAMRFEDTLRANPEIGRYATDALNMSNLALPEVVTKVAPARSPKASVAQGKAAVAQGVEAGKAAGGTSNIRQSIQTMVAERNVDPRLKSSAERLFMQGTADMPDPVARYDQFLQQSKAAVSDAKADPAVSVVGEEIGKSFERVVDMRRQVGKQMQTELQSIGDKPANTRPAIADFYTSLDEADLSGGATKDGLSAGKASKMSPDDVQLLQTYASQLNKLGAFPTVAEVDAFLSRVQSSLDYYKSAKGLVETTPGERIIKKNLSKVREQFDPAVNGDKAFEKYWTARKTYADLSDFIDEGAGFLGKYTQSGDFAKDASLAKSAVQSVLNNGKKDWLMRLEKLTGYPALDESVLALQAMRDAGDFRGTSLLQLLSEGSVPTSATGVAGKLASYLANKGAEIVAGSPEEQTRAFLRSLKKQDATMTANEPITAVDNSLFGRAKSFVSDTIDRAKKDGQRGFARNPLAGETKKAVSPENIAKNVDRADLKLMMDYLDDKSVGNLMKMQRMLEEMGADKLSIDDLNRFMQEVINERGNMGRKLDIQSE